MSPAEMPREWRTMLDTLSKELHNLEKFLDFAKQKQFKFESEKTTQQIGEESLTHYLKAQELSEKKYGDYANKLIDQYLKMGNYNKAIELYTKFKSAFPDHSLYINPHAFILKAKNIPYPSNMMQPFLLC